MALVAGVAGVADGARVGLGLRDSPQEERGAPRGGVVGRGWQPANPGHGAYSGSKGPRHGKSPVRVEQSGHDVRAREIHSHVGRQGAAQRPTGEHGLQHHLLPALQVRTAHILTTLNVTS